MQYQLPIFDFQEDNQELVEECLRHAPLSSMKRDDRAYLLNLMLEYRLYEIAYPDIREFGWEGIRLEKLTALLTYEIEEVDYESDDFLLALCAVTFQAKKYSKEILLRSDPCNGGGLVSSADF